MYSIFLLALWCVDVCKLPVEKGDVCEGGEKPHKAYYFESDTRRCEKFKYTGCGGNKNNFKSKKECQKQCRGMNVE